MNAIYPNRINFYGETNVAKSPNGKPISLAITRHEGEKGYSLLEIAYDETEKRWAQFAVIGRFFPEKGDCDDCGLSELINTLKDLGVCFHPSTKDDLMRKLGIGDAD